MNYKLNPWRFLAWFVGLSLGLPLLIWALDAVTGVNLDSSAIGIIPLFIAALQEGVAFARAEARAPTGPEARRISVRMVALAAAAAIVQFAIVAAIFPEILSMLGAVGGFAIVIVMLFLGVGFLVAWGFFTMGARSHLKAEAKKRSNG